MQRLVVGLGNPGKSYHMTRHNIGFLVLESLARSLGWTFKEERRYRAASAKGKIGELTVHLLLPLTYMNCSGEAVRAYTDYYKIPAQHSLVVLDDQAIPFGDIRLRARGSAGGHNGLKNIEQHLATRDYPRLKLGIGAATRGSLSDHVLGKFSVDENLQLDRLLRQAVEAVMSWINIDDIAKAMTLVNTKEQERIQPPPKGSEILETERPGE